MGSDVGGSVEAAGARMWRRSRNILIVGYAAIGVLIGFMGWLVLEGANMGLYNEVYLFVLVPALLGYSVYAQWRYTRKTVEFVRTLAPRLRDVVFERRVGIIAVFDNGLLFRQLRVGGNGPAGLLFATFMDASREPLIPTKDQMVPWSKSFGRRQKIGTVSKKKGPEGARAQLEAIRQALGSSSALSVVEHHDGTEPGTPSFYAGIILMDRKWITKASLVLGQLDAVDMFLKQMPTQDFSVPLAPR